MSTSEKNINNIRLLLTDQKGGEVAIPFNDQLGIRSGLQFNQMPQPISERLGDTWGEQGEADKSISTLDSDHCEGRLVVTLSISEIFKRAASAQKSNELLVDLTADSGFEALIKKTSATKPPAPKRKR
jgi:hypothetical protein